MKRLLLVLGFALLSGCVREHVSATAGQTVYGEIGSPFITWGGQNDILLGATPTKTLTYTGLDGETVRIQYRETIATPQGQIARPAFTTDLTYPAKPGQIVSYQGASFVLNEVSAERIVLLVKTAPAISN